MSERISKEEFEHEVENLMTQIDALKKSGVQSIKTRSAGILLTSVIKIPHPPLNRTIYSISNSE